MRKEKKLLLEEMQGKLVGSAGFILTRYTQMNPNLSSEFRFDLMKSGGDFEVMRKRILMKAAAAAGITLERSLLEGHIALVFATDDLLPTAKTVFKFKSNHENVLEILGGRFEGKLYSAQEVEAISQLPSKPEMQAQLLGLFEAVPSQLLAVFEALLASPLHCLNNKTPN